MPPKVKITKEDIIQSAVELVRANGEAALNVRAIAAALHCSTQPVFSNFATMSELREAVTMAAYECYLDFLKREEESGNYPQYKSFGMAYIRFAKEEKELFKLLYMRNRSGEDVSCGTELFDRMKDLELTGEPRCGAETYNELSMETYLQEHFGMYQGERDHIRIRALNVLLDTFVDRFGTRDVIYAKDDDKHFTAIVNVAVSNQFYGWLCGLGNKVKIISPAPVVEDFKQYLDKMRGLYD